MAYRNAEFLETELIYIEALDSTGRGIGRYPNSKALSHMPRSGKVVFIEGALPGEQIRYRVSKIRHNYLEGQLVEIIHASSQRVQPRCIYFTKCGGCALQHLNSQTQLAVKQRHLEDNLWHISKVHAEHILRPIAGTTWHYRHRARLSVRYIKKRDGILIGFYERKSNQVTDMMSCEILPDYISALLPALRQLITSLSLHAHIPQIELAIGTEVNALALKILFPLTTDDKTKLRDFADLHNVQFWLQPKGLDSIYCFYPQHKKLNYALPEFGITMPFLPTDFTQVNHQINQILIRHALNLLEAQPDEHILDLFCGIGNFTLPLATQSRQVVGIEGSQILCTRAQENAILNQLQSKTRFINQNLFEVNEKHIRYWGKFARWLIDPPREGAQALIRALTQLRESTPDYLPQRIVYVSCNPATLARDAGILVHQTGYQLSATGIVNMFPHTTHIESVAVFNLLNISK